MKKILMIASIAIFSLAVPPTVSAADNMCNVNLNCNTPEEWIAGWFAARQPENASAVPQQTEYTNANDDKDHNTPGVQAEVIRYTGESGVGDPGDGNRNKGGITVETGETYGQTDPGLSGGSSGQTGGDAGACYGLGDRNLEAKCIANAKGGQYQAGDCRIGDCLSSGYVVYCQGPQETADSPRAGEFLTCGPQFTSTGGCGQADVYASKQAYDSGLMPTGFIIDKSNCAAAPPQVTTEEAPPREFPPAPPGEQPTATPTATPTPVTISANCQSLAGQVSDGAGGWTTKTDSEFAAAARPGDRVRFVCTGAKSRGNFTKSAFFINSILHVDDVVKLNETQFAVEYTIPAAGALTVESVLLHDNKGWVD